MKTFIQSGSGNSATLNEANPSKIKVYESWSKATSDLANIENNEIVAVREGNDSDVKDATVPTGTVVAFGGTVIPEGWLLCDGSEFDTDTYSVLHNVLDKNTVPDLIDRSLGSTEVDNVSGTMSAGSAGGVKIREVSVPKVGLYEVILWMEGSTTSGTMTSYFENWQGCELVGGRTFRMSSEAAGGGSTFTILVRVTEENAHFDWIWHRSTNNELRWRYTTRYLGENTNTYIIKAAPNLNEVPNIQLNTPVGTVISYKGHTTPVGYLPCNGDTFEEADYPLLYNALGGNTLPYEMDYGSELLVGTNVTELDRFNITSQTVNYDKTFTMDDDGTFVLNGSADNTDRNIWGVFVDGVCVCSDVRTTNPNRTHFACRVKKGQQVRVSISMDSAWDGSANITYLRFYTGDVPYKYIKATSGIEAEQETIATYVNEALKPVSITGSGTSGLSYRATRTGNVVSVNCFISANLAQGQDVSFGTLPEGWRPKYDTKFLLQIGGGTFNYDAGVIAHVLTDGRILAYTYKAFYTSTNNCLGTCTYILEE